MTTEALSTPGWFARKASLIDERRKLRDKTRTLADVERGRMENMLVAIVLLVMVAIGNISMAFVSLNSASDGPMNLKTLPLDYPAPVSRDQMVDIFLRVGVLTSAELVMAGLLMMTNFLLVGAGIAAAWRFRASAWSCIPYLLVVLMISPAVEWVLSFPIVWVLHDVFKGDPKGYVAAVADLIRSQNRAVGVGDLVPMYLFPLVLGAGQFLFHRQNTTWEAAISARTKEPVNLPLTAD